MHRFRCAGARARPSTAQLLTSKPHFRNHTIATAMLHSEPSLSYVLAADSLAAAEPGRCVCTCRAVHSDPELWIAAIPLKPGDQRCSAPAAPPAARRPPPPLRAFAKRLPTAPRCTPIFLPACLQQHGASLGGCLWPPRSLAGCARPGQLGGGASSNGGRRSRGHHPRPPSAAGASRRRRAALALSAGQAVGAERARPACGPSGEYAREGLSACFPALVSISCARPRHTPFSTPLPRPTRGLQPLLPPSKLPPLPPLSEEAAATLRQPPPQQQPLPGAAGGSSNSSSSKNEPLSVETLLLHHRQHWAAVRRHQQQQSAAAGQRYAQRLQGLLTLPGSSVGVQH